MKSINLRKCSIRFWKGYNNIFQQIARICSHFLYNSRTLNIKIIYDVYAHWASYYYLFHGITCIFLCSLMSGKVLDVSCYVYNTELKLSCLCENVIAFCIFCFNYNVTVMILDLLSKSRKIKDLMTFCQNHLHTIRVYDICTALSNWFSKQKNAFPESSIKFSIQKWWCWCYQA